MSDLSWDDCRVKRFARVILSDLAGRVSWLLAAGGSWWIWTVLRAQPSVLCGAAIILINRGIRRVRQLDWPALLIALFHTRGFDKFSDRHWSVHERSKASNV